MGTLRSAYTLTPTSHDLNAFDASIKVYFSLSYLRASLVYSPHLHYAESAGCAFVDKTRRIGDVQTGNTYQAASNQYVPATALK